MKLTPPWKIKDRIDRYSCYLSFAMVAYLAINLFVDADLKMPQVMTVYIIVLLATSIRSLIQMQRLDRRYKQEREKATHELPPDRQEEIQINWARHVLAQRKGPTE